MTPRNTIRTLLGEIISRDPADLKASFPLSAEGGVAPIDLAQLAMACEEAFRLTLHDERIAAWRTLGDVFQEIEALLEAGQGEPLERTEESREGWYYE